MKTMVIGSNHENTANYYLQLNLPISKLITSAKQEYTVGHTCIQDVPDHLQLEKILSGADRVYWSTPAVEEFSDFEAYIDFLNWLKDYNLQYRNVVNLGSIKFDPYGWNKHIPVHKNQAVFLGCSFTAGVGLPDPTTHYASLTAQHFNLDLLNLSVPGSSNNLIFEKFFQIDFFPEQLIVVQFTFLGRLRYCDHTNKLKNIMLADSHGLDKNLHRYMLEIYNKDFLFYEFLVKLRAMITIADSKKLRLIFWLADYKNKNEYSILDQTYFYHLKQFVPASWIQDYLIDVAQDKKHPGVESNKILSQILIKYIETVYGTQKQ
jgi:hypothetical protein